MLVFISDLHFEDGSAGTHNINFHAFKGFTEDLIQLSEDAKEVQIILLGDIFDLNRSATWFEAGMTKPWSTEDLFSPEVGRSAGKILSKIINGNRQSLDIIKSWTNGALGNKKVEIIFIPGNHDRLVNCFPHLRARIRKIFNMSDSDAEFDHVFKNQECKVFAFHGHEYDPTNFGTDFKHGIHFDDQDMYQRIPMGDVISAEFGAQLYYLAKMMQNQQHIPDSPEFTMFLEHISEIDNVRPSSAVFDWLYYQLKNEKSYADFFKMVIDQVVHNILGLDYVQKWLDLNKEYGALYKLADGIETLYNILAKKDKNITGDIVEWYFSHLYGKLGSGEHHNETIRDQVSSTLIPIWGDYDYFIAGHTHKHILMPIRVMNDGREKVYINTGTWRKNVLKCYQPGYHIVNQLTSLCFYSPDENHDKKRNQIYEIWNGTLKEEAN
ncbi:MAG TPA: metallophosphoesterase, partial [Candidatus Cloacimonadota bacterium]|nr:metallophosphoesterase [Candidatus Cloacimonadota bacterium]